jgi:hypothetical protein
MFQVYFRHSSIHFKKIKNLLHLMNLGDIVRSISESDHQRERLNMSQGMLPFKEEEKTLSCSISLASLADLPVCLEFAKFIGSEKFIAPLLSV